MSHHLLRRLSLLARSRVMTLQVGVVELHLLKGMHFKLALLLPVPMSMYLMVHQSHCRTPWMLYERLLGRLGLLKV